MSDENHLKLLRLLEENPDMSQRELSRRLGISLGKTNYCLKAMLGGGLIKIQNFKNSNNKLAYAYLLTPVGATTKAELTLRFLKIKVKEYKALKTEIEQLEQEAERFTAESGYSTHIKRSQVK